MAPKSQPLSSSRWATTSRNTSTVGRSFDNFSRSYPTHLPTARPASPEKNGAPKLAAVSSPEEPRLTESQKEFRLRLHSYQVFTKYYRRVKWKSLILLHSYGHTLNLIHHGATSHVHVIGGVPFPMQPGEAEIMFKIDFFEFYSILENTIVSLLKVFGVEVSAMYGANIRSIESDGARQESEVGSSIRASAEITGLIGDSRIIQKSRHRFHANVLLALDDLSCPLREVMGQGAVRDYLGIAKEWRNKWKNVEEEGKDERKDGLIGSRYEKMIQDLNLEEMLREIAVAIEKSEKLAQDTLNHMSIDLSRDGLDHGTMEVDLGMDETMELSTGDMMDWD